MKQLNCKIEKRRPVLREVVVQYSLDGRDELITDERLRGRKNGQQAFSQALLLVVCYKIWSGRHMVATPGLIDTALETDNSYGHAVSTLQYPCLLSADRFDTSDKGRIIGGWGGVPASWTLLSCSPTSISQMTSVKPGNFST